MKYNEGYSKMLRFESKRMPPRTEGEKKRRLGGREEKDYLFLALIQQYQPGTERKEGSCQVPSCNEQVP